MPENAIPILDHGYVCLVESYGSDAAIIEAARMSTNKGFQGWGHDCWCVDGTAPYPGTDEWGVCSNCKGKGHVEGDERLLRYLYRNRHMSPFEMAGAVFEVQAPIFVFREWHRHRTQSYNEMSARYTPLPDVNYIPTVDRLMMGAGGTNKQAGTISEAKSLTEEVAERFRSTLEEGYRLAEDTYQEALFSGIPKELARVLLPVGRYSRMRASANLRNWLGFLSLRLEESAQWEIRQYAEAISQLLTEKFPRTLALFAE